MLRYLLIRLLLVLPTIWLISSVVFLLSRIVPGSYADRIDEAEQATISSNNFSANRKTYLAQLQDEGRDLPLFYFSVTTRAQPDTLYRVFPTQHQQLLQQLLNQYGNWPFVAAYYQSLCALKLAGTWPDTAEVLLHTAKPDDMASIWRKVPTAQGNSIDAIFQAKLRFTQMQHHAKPFNLLIPDWRWHGWHNQYHSWLTGLIKGNLGKSYRDEQPVWLKIGEAIGNTLLLLIGSLLLTFWFSIELSLVLCRWQKGRNSVLAILYILDSIPLFIVALLLLTLLLGSGYINISSVLSLNDASDLATSFSELFLTRLSQLLLPALCLILTGMPYVTTQLYQVLQQVLHSEFIKTARSKGLSEERILRKHAFRNALLPLITLFTGYLPGLISGAVVIEVIFALPGTGRLLTESVFARDYPVIIGLVLFLAALKAISHVLADFLYFSADPRTRSSTA